MTSYTKKTIKKQRLSNKCSNADSILCPNQELCTKTPEQNNTGSNLVPYANINRVYKKS